MCDCFVVVCFLFLCFFVRLFLYFILFFFFSLSFFSSLFSFFRFLFICLFYYPDTCTATCRLREYLSVSGVWLLLWKSLIMAEDSAQLTMQTITTRQSIIGGPAGVTAGVVSQRKPVGSLSG